MPAMKPIAMIDILKAFLNKETIQYRYNAQRGEGDWNDVAQDPVWNFATYEYRVKPVPKTLYVIDIGHGVPGRENFLTKKAAEVSGRHGDAEKNKVLKFVQVLDS